MARIEISNLSFAYDDGTVIFDNLTLSLDTTWKLGLIGRNGRGKTTLLKILSGSLKAKGAISLPGPSVYYPPEIEDPEKSALDAALASYPEAAQWRFRKEASLIGLPEEALERSLSSLSGGERARVLLAGLFAGGENSIALIDEPTTHLDLKGHEIARSYLASKKGFVLASHDRALLDACADHVLSINRASVTLEAGNYSSWLENRKRREKFELGEREKLKTEIARLKEDNLREASWAKKSESQKFNMGKCDRGWITHIAAKVAKKAKSAQKKAEKALSAKEGLVKSRDDEKQGKLSMAPLASRSKILAEGRGLALGYGDEAILRDLDFVIHRGEIVALSGPNGSGKTLLMKALSKEIAPLSGTLHLAPDLVVSAVPQIPAYDFPSISRLARSLGLEESLAKAVLSHLGFEPDRLGALMSEMSTGQLKKIALALSFCQSASLYLWDEPLSHIDIIARGLVEDAVLSHRPSMVVVEHDQAFVEKVANRTIRLER